MHKSILAPSQSNVSGSVLRLKAVEMHAQPPVCLPCAFSNWTVYYTWARCSFGWNLESLGTAWTSGRLRIMVPRGCIEALSRAAKVSSAGCSPGLGDITCHGHDWHNRLEAGEQCARACRLRAVVRTSEPWAHKPLGAGSSVLSSKDFRPQLELRHVLIRTDKHVCGSYINQYKAYDPTSMQRISCYVRTVTFSQSEQRTSPVFWTTGRTCFRGRGFLKESGGCTLSRFGWFGLPTGQRRWICLPRARECTLPAVRLPVSLPAEGGSADIALASS